MARIRHSISLPRPKGALIAFRDGSSWLLRCLIIVFVTELAAFADCYEGQALVRLDGGNAVIGYKVQPGQLTVKIKNPDEVIGRIGKPARKVRDVYAPAPTTKLIRMPGLSCELCSRGLRFENGNFSYVVDRAKTDTSTHESIKARNCLSCTGYQSEDGKFTFTIQRFAIGEMVTLLKGLTPDEGLAATSGCFTEEVIEKGAGAKESRGTPVPDR